MHTCIYTYIYMLRGRSQFGWLSTKTIESCRAGNELVRFFFFLSFHWVLLFFPILQSLHNQVLANNQCNNSDAKDDSSIWQCLGVQRQKNSLTAFSAVNARLESLVAGVRLLNLHCQKLSPSTQFWCTIIAVQDNNNNNNQRASSSFERKQPPPPPLKCSILFCFSVSLSPKSSI